MNGDAFGNAVRARVFDWRRQLQRLGQPTDRGEWGMTPQTINAYYNPTFNEVVFPAAILQPPFFDPHADPAVNYGGIGAVIGHEMGHGFDDQGSKSDARGVLRAWWQPQDTEAFKKRVDHLAAQYDGFTVLPGLNVNGRLTLGENIGDLGGLSVSLDAYHRCSRGASRAGAATGSRGDQRFFLACAQVWRSLDRDEQLRSQVMTDPHSPPKFRVNGVVRNVDAWYAAFDVKPGDQLYLRAGRARAHLVSPALPIEAALPQLHGRAARPYGGGAAGPARGRQEHGRAAGAARGAVAARPEASLMLEPRRLAARAVAARMAQTLGERVGDTVGYRMRMDTRVSRATRIEVVTEGVLTRMLQADPALEGVAAVIFDEFHERSLQADLGLALVLDARAQPRPGAAPAGHVGDARRRGRGAPARRCAARERAGPQLSRRDALRAATGSAAAAAAGRAPGHARAARDAADRARAARGAGRRAGVPARRARDPPRAGAARRDAARRRTRSVLPLFGELSGEAAGRRARPGGSAGRARSCSPPTSPRPASPSRACASWSTRAWCGARASIRSPA